MKAFSRMAKFYRFSHQEMEQMHFVTFFAYVREASEINDEEERAFERAKQQGAGQQVVEAEAVAGALPQMQNYEGETVALR
jgi:hypothetical protein